MKKFRFNLEALEKLYRIKEEEKKRQLADANRLFIQAEQELTRLGKEYDDSQEMELRRRENGESVYSMRLFVQYAFDIKNRIETQKKRVIEVSRLLNEAKKEVMEAKRRVKSMDKIRERRYNLWKKERGRFEAKTLDDLCQQQFIRNEMG